MILQRYEYRDEDFRFYHLSQAVGRMSDCKDKRVGAIIVEYGVVQGIGYNYVLDCNMLCDKSCVVKHAETQALSMANGRLSAAVCYVNLFPCAACQTALYYQGVKTIKVFGEQGNKPLTLEWAGATNHIFLLPDLPSLLLKMNGDRNQRQVCQGELMELGTEISNHDARTDRPESKAKIVEAIRSEMVDVDLQILALDRSLPLELLHIQGVGKWNRLIAKFKDKFFPNKDL